MNKNSRSLDKAIIIIFLVLLVGPAIGYTIPASVSLVDRRALASWPSLENGNLQKLARDIEAYASDHFFGRQMLFKTRDGIWRALGLSSNRKVIFGSDGWMYLFRDQGIAEYSESYYRSVNESQWLSDILCRQATCAKYGARYFCVIAPNKQSIHPENLPGWTGRTAPVTRWQEVRARLGARMPECVIDLTDLLLSIRKALPEQPLYFKTDSHWLGATGSIAVSYIQDRIAGNSSDFDLYSNMASRMYPTLDCVTDLLPLVGQKPCSEVDWQLPEVFESRSWWYVGMPALNEAANIYRNQMAGITATVNPAGCHRAILIRDSYGVAMLPALCKSYKSMIIANRGAVAGNLFCHLLDRTQPDIVIEEFLEDNAVPRKSLLLLPAPIADKTLNDAFGRDICKLPIAAQLDIDVIPRASSVDGEFRVSSGGSQGISGWVKVNGEPASAVAVVNKGRVIWVDQVHLEHLRDDSFCKFDFQVPAYILEQVTDDLEVLAISSQQVVRLARSFNI